MAISKLIGQEKSQSGPKRTQVWLATHEEGGKRLPLMHRSFISFIYDGRYCEDMGIISVVSGDRMERNLYADFGDNVTESDVLDGQYYWSTHFKTNSLSLTLATDAITENQLGEIKRWLRPGPPRLLILSEHPFRGIYARISSPPSYSVLPFEEKISLKVAGAKVKTSTTVYRGEISVEFVMDDPFWFSLNNILDVKTGEDTYTPGYWVDAQGDNSLILLDKDALKVIQEDQIAASAMINSNNIIFGNGIRAVTEDELMTDVIDEATGEETDPDEWKEVGSGNSVIAPMFDKTVSTAGDQGLELTGHTIKETGYNVYKKKFAIVGYGRLGNLLVKENINLPKYNASTPAENCVYLYYPGTAPSAPIIEFDLTPQFNETTHYLISPYNEKTANEYNTITVEGAEGIYEFNFTTPSVYTAYNQAIEILNREFNGDGVELANAIKDGVNHPHVRAYVLYLFNYIKTSSDFNSAQKNSYQSTAIPLLKEMFKDLENDQLASSHYTLNCATGEMRGKFSYRKPPTTGSVCSWEENQWEDVGNMLRTNNFQIIERNYPDADGFIQTWQYNKNEIKAIESSKKYTHKVYHNVDGGLNNFSIKYAINYY